MRYDLIIFDCDGTLVDTESVTRRVFEEVMRAYGLSDQQLTVLDDMRGAHMGSMTDYMASIVDDFDADIFIKRYRSRCEELFKVSTDAIPGVARLLSDLGGHHCIGSNAPHSKMQITLASSGIMKYFAPENIHSAYDIHRWKPDPALYIHILEIYGVSPDRAVVIEDSAHGAMASVRAGIDVILYDPHGLDEMSNIDAPKYDSMEAIYTHFDKVGMIIKE